LEKETIFKALSQQVNQQYTEYKILFKPIFQIFPTTQGRTKHLITFNQANLAGNGASTVQRKLQNSKVMYWQMQLFLPTLHKTMQRLVLITNKV